MSKVERRFVPCLDQDRKCDYCGGVIKQGEMALLSYYRWLHYPLCPAAPVANRGHYNPGDNEDDGYPD
jgi:hypothetical protein